MEAEPRRPTGAQTPRAARLAVGLAFFINGAALSNWVPRIPEIKAALGLSAGGLGTALLGVGLGALAGSVLAAPWVARRGSRSITVAAGVALTLALPLPGLAPAWLWLLAALVVLGLCDAVMDVAMNAHGVLVERRYGRSILNGFHAIWSLGALAGALMGSAAAAAAIPPAWHLAGAGVALAVLALATGPGMARVAAEDDQARPAGLVRPTRTVGVLGVLVLCAALIEGVPADWSAVYLTEELGASAGAAGTAYAAFAAAMLVGRLGGDTAVTRWGAVATARTGALLAGGGLAAGLALDDPVAAVVAFGCVGLGVCTVFPAVFSAAGHLPGMPQGAAIAMVSLVARFGFLIGPPLVGGLAELATLPLALLVAVAAAAAIAVLARGVAPAG